jgi:2-polyprenyl-6-methoxyphenol hydroxylase-like FAD-dependent oxidoreductase
VVQTAPLLGAHIGDVRSWDDVKLLTVAVDRLLDWSKPGLLCIGDAAHAMSPIGGVGINLAIQDAVAAANLLYTPLQRGVPTAAELQAVQRRRELPTRITQRMQVIIQNNVLVRTLRAKGPVKIPRAVRLLNRYPLLRRIPARLVGMGFRPEHVRTPEYEV